MSEQERIRKHVQGKRREREEEMSASPLGGEEQVAQAAEGVAAVRDVIDDILAGYISPEGPTVIIGSVSSVKRPSLREISSEEFIRSFRQKTGQ